MKKIIDELINSSIGGVDVYRYKNATWLIFTDETRWVVELTDEGTLWYNYKFFNNVFRYVSMTVGKEMEEYVIQWANDFFYKDCAHRSIAYPRDKGRNETPKVVKNGIKETKGCDLEIKWHTHEVMNDGVKEVYDSSSTHRQMRAENLIPRIVKDVRPNRVTVHDEKMDRFYYSTDCTGNNTEIFRIIEEGVKEVKPNIEYSKQSGVFHPDCAANHVKIKKVIEEGVKKIYPDRMSGDDGYNWSNEFEADKVIERGVKL